MIELLVLNYIFQTNSFRFVILNGITEEYFTTYKKQFQFLKTYYEKYNQLPSKEIFQSEFDGEFEWINVTDSEKYLYDKLNEAKLYRALVKDFNVLKDYIKDEKTDKAVAEMAKMAQQFLKQQQTQSVDLITDAKLRYEKYLEKVQNHEKAFVTTGCKELDEILGGWDVENETAIIAARTGLGKTWWLIYFALAAAKQGLRVGFYSGEMETDLIGYRLDTFLGNISNGALTHGNENVQLTYKAYIEKITEMVKGNVICITPDMIDGSATVSKLRAFVEKYDIQFLCIDQFSLLEDEKKARNPREQMINISKDLRNLQRLKKIPIIAAVQLNREDISEDGPSTKNISESDRIGQDATTVLFIERQKSQKNADGNKDKTAMITITVGKARNAQTGDKLHYAWNINTGYLEFIPTEKDARHGEGAEALRDSYNDKASDDGGPF